MRPQDEHGTLVEQSDRPESSRESSDDQRCSRARPHMLLRSQDTQVKTPVEPKGAMITTSHLSVAPETLKHENGRAQRSDQNEKRQQTENEKKYT
jgi:hypothetical protein